MLLSQQLQDDAYTAFRLGCGNAAMGSLLCRYRSCSPGNWKALLFAWSWLALNWAGLN